MTKKGFDDLSDASKVKAAGTRGYKGEPEPADQPAEAPAPVTTVPVGQEDADGMKQVEEQSVEDAGKAAE